MSQTPPLRAAEEACALSVNQKPYKTYRSYLRERFGERVLKVPINAGFSCPNRDGTLSQSGCLFCDNRAFSPAARETATPRSQLERAIERSSGYRLFLPYLQPFTNTYAEPSRLRRIYEPLLGVRGVVGLAIGTRPDCLSDAVVDYCADVNSRTYLSIEIGLQSASNAVLSAINRGHSVEQFEDAVDRLAKRNIESVAHVMLGLPGETEQSIRNMAHTIARLPVAGVKIHQLMIIEGTACAAWFYRGEIQPLELEEYACLAGAFIARLRQDQHIHRIMADSRPERGLIAPLWSAHKALSIRVIDDYMRREGLSQGRLFTE